MKLKRKPTCHPNLSRYARGLCIHCYRVKKYSKNPNRKPCRGCGAEKKDIKERAHFCNKCKDSPLNRPLLQDATCVKGHKYSETGLTVWKSQRWCKACLIEMRKKNWVDPIKQQKSREDGKTYSILRNFGLTKEDWLKIYDHQAGICPICKKKLKRWFDDTGGIPAAVDHCHKSGLIRGLICRYPCNYTLGQLRDNAELFRACADYLDDPSATKAFGEARFTAPGKVGSKKRQKVLNQKSLTKPQTCGKMDT